MIHKDIRRERYNTDEKFRKQERIRTNQASKTTQQKYRLIVITHYSKRTMKCNCCGESMYIFLTIDHENNDGAEHRRKIGNGYLYRWLIKNNFPKGFQVLCYNCNIGKSKNKGICPHKHINKRFT